MPLSRVILTACLTVMSFLMLLAAALFLVAVLAQAMGRVIPARPEALLAMAVAFAAGGIGARWLVRRVERLGEGEP